MSLSQLLAVGRSIKGGKDMPNPYRMTDQNRLPKFAPVGRPISLAPAPKPFAETAQLFFAARKAHQPSSVAAAPGTGPGVSAPGTAAPARTGLARLNPFASKSAGSRTLVQAELSLDAVKVVRNDLSDADLELIPAAPPEPVEAPRTGTESVKPGHRPTVWSRLTARWLRLGRARH